MGRGWSTTPPFSIVFIARVAINTRWLMAFITMNMGMGSSFWDFVDQVLECRQGIHVYVLLACSGHCYPGLEGSIAFSIDWLRYF